jgi:hypothetical protein
MVVWGTIACCHAAAKNYAQLMVLRVLLGFFESGFFVCVTLINAVGDSLGVINPSSNLFWFLHVRSQVSASIGGRISRGTKH